MAFVLGGSLVLSQVRAIQLYLVSHKLDYNRLLPRVERNYSLSMSTYFLGLAVIYKKHLVNPSENSISAYRAYIKEREDMMSYSGFGGNDQHKKKQKCGGCC